MENPKFNINDELVRIGKLFTFGTEMKDSDKEIVFGLVDNYINSLVIDKAVMGYSQQSPEVKKYLNLAVLGRIVSLRDQANKKDFIFSEATVRFITLKGIVCSQLFTDPHFVSDDYFADFVNTEIEDRIDSLLLSKNVRDNMDFIRKIGSIIIPNNIYNENGYFRMDRKSD